MRRSDREIKEVGTILEIIDQCKVCRLAMNDDEGVYIVPLNFGYEYAQDKLVLYFHSAGEGRKINALSQSQEICFEMDCAHRLLEGKNACDYGYSFKSIIGYGQVTFIEELAKKSRALTFLMKQQAKLVGEDLAQMTFDEHWLTTASVFELEVGRLTGKWCQ